jgi:hypothetical protein
MELSGRFADGIQSSAKFSPADALDIAESEYRDDFLAYWGLTASEPPDELDKDKWLEYRRLYGIAGQIADAARTLLRRKGLGPHNLSLPQRLAEEAGGRQRIIDELLNQARQLLGHADYLELWQQLMPGDPQDPRTKHYVFRNALQLEVIRLFPYDPNQMAERLIRLTAYLVRYSNERTAAYLVRVAHCYAIDLKTELAAMARAVLDTALQDYIDDEAVRREIIIGRYVTLDARLQYCRSKGILTRDALAAADLVKKSGDDAIHMAPGLEADPNRVLESLAVVLQALDAHFERK